jgi:hypothetical protein
MSISSIVVIAIVAFMAGVLVGYFCHSFFSSSKTEKIAQIKEILLYLVAMAEKELGGGTGNLKLAKVYNEFTSEYPDLAKVITYEQFTELVDEVLIKFENLLRDNAKAKQLIEGSESKS